MDRRGTRIATLEWALRLVLPLAKGYYAANPHESNRDCILVAEEALSPMPSSDEERT